MSKSQRYVLKQQSMFALFYARVFIYFLRRGLLQSVVKFYLLASQNALATKVATGKLPTSGLTNNKTDPR